MAVWDSGDGEEFLQCPMLWVTADIFDWYQEYLYDTEFHSSPPYHRQSAKYIDAWLVYRHYLNKYQAEQMREQSKRNDLGRMGSNLIKQRQGIDG